MIHNDDASQVAALSPIEFGLRADNWLREQYPERDNTANTLMLFLNRAAGEFTARVEHDVHKPMGLSWVGYKLLFVLWIAGDLQPIRAAKLMQASRAAVSSISAGFLDEGLIEKRPSPTDGRSIVLSLTSKGREKVVAAYQAAESLQKDIFSSLSKTEQEILLLLLSKLMADN